MFGIATSRRPWQGGGTGRRPGCISWHQVPSADAVRSLSAIRAVGTRGAPERRANVVAVRVQRLAALNVAFSQGCRVPAWLPPQSDSRPRYPPGARRPA